MKLLTDELRARLPPLYSQEAEAEPMVYAKFFMPGTAGLGTSPKAANRRATFCSSASWSDSKASSATSCSRSSSRSQTRSGSTWSAIYRSAKASSPMLYPRPIHDGAGAAARPRFVRCVLLLRDQGTVLGLFFMARF